MIYHDFQGERLSALGLGCMRLPVIEGDSARIDVPAVERMVDEALAQGVNYFDTAHGYHKGTSQAVMGAVLGRHDRSSFNVATKFPGYNTDNFGKVEQIFEDQLQKLAMDHVDFYLCHNLSESNIDQYLDDERYGTVSYLLEQKRAGRIRHLGFSDHSSFATFKRFLDAYGDVIEFCQVQLNYMDWDFQNAKAKVEYLNRLGIPIWVMEPLRGGHLVELPADAQARLPALNPNENAISWAFRFLQSIPGVTLVLSGASNLEQLNENIRLFADERPLDAREFDGLAGIGRAIAWSKSLPCTACEYCLDYCPQNLDIPYLISLYNEHASKDEESFIAPMSIRALPADKRPGACIGCGSCEKVCPQQLPIARTFAAFDQTLAEPDVSSRKAAGPDASPRKMPAKPVDSFSETNRDALVEYFRAGEKETRTFGFELEHVLVRKNTGAPVSYSEPQGVRAVLERLAESVDTLVHEGDSLVGLTRGTWAVSLEPAAQLEVSAGPFEKVVEAEESYLEFRSFLDPVLEEFGIMTPMVGYVPSARACDLELIPKFRYESMDRFLSEESPWGARMMRGSASLQVSIDYASEKDAMRKLRVAEQIAPVLAHICDNTPIFENEERSGHMARTAVWTGMRQDRVGTVPGSLAPGFGYRDYADYLLTRGAILVPDAEAAVGWRFVGAQTFDEAYAERAMGAADVEHALSMVWPDARLKNFVEIRPADALPFDFSLAYMALVRGLFYNEQNLAALEALLSGAGENEVRSAKEALMREGYAAHVYGRSIDFWVDTLVTLALGATDSSELSYLEPLASMTRNRFTLADAYQDPHKREQGYKEAISHLAVKTGTPRIGIFPRYDFELTGLSISEGYTTGVLVSGGLPFVLPLTDNLCVLDRIVDVCDGFIIPGGQDIDPDFYGQKRDVRLHRVTRQRDEMEQALIPRILEAGKPILGICRGMQALNVATKGTLYQDIHRTHPASTIRHAQRRPFTAPTHEVDVVPGSLLAQITESQRFGVNSLHHQCVCEPGRGMAVSARADDGVIEAIEMPDAAFVIGVQWHPELLWRTQPEARRLFEALVKAASVEGGMLSFGA